MTTDETGAALVAALADERLPPTELPRRLCSTVCAALGADGATLSLLTDTPARQLLGASDARALRLEEIQFTVLEGPCMTAAADGDVVAVDALEEAAARWPLFAQSMSEQLPQARAVYAFPLYFGDYVLGTMDLLGVRPDALGETTLRDGPAVADAVVALLMPAGRMLFPGTEPPAWEPVDVVRAHWYDTHRAVEMVAARRAISPEDALALVRALAFSRGQSLTEITADLLGPPPAP
jgi:hypothetical protein